MKNLLAAVMTMIKRILPLLLLASPAFAQTSFYSNQATQAVSIIGSPQPVQGPIPFAGVRVCNLPLTQTAPCLPLATITDSSGNTLSNSIGSNFGQFTADAFGRFTFGCTTGANLRLQWSGASNTPQGDIPITCPGSGFQIGGNNAFTGNNTHSGTETFSGAVVASAIGPSAAQQHTLPAVTSDTISLLAASQTFTNKTIVNALAIPASTVGFGFTIQGLASQVASPFVVQTNGGASNLFAVTAAGNAQITGVVQNAGAGATMGLTLKKGSGAGNYTNATTTYAVADSTNLCFTVTIPTGWKLGVSAQGALSTATAAVVAQAALTDNAACSTANAGILVETAPIQGAGISISDAFALDWVITGDGAAHNVALQFKTSNAADTASLINSSATITPTMKFELMPSN